MAGLVPVIHVLHYLRMAGGYIYFMTNRPNGILYVGVTNDLIRRVYEHPSGFVKGFTKRYDLKRLVYFEQFDTIQDAIQREHNQALAPRLESSIDCREQSRVGRPLRDDRKVRRGWPGQARP
jgi:putative endonuclease